MIENLKIMMEKQSIIILILVPIVNRKIFILFKKSEGIDRNIII